MPADALTFEGPLATMNQLQRLAKFADPSYVVEDTDARIGGHSWNEGCGGHPPPEQPPPAGHEEHIEVMEGDRCTMRLFISPAELPN
jgi:hypothetical protein